MGVRACSRRAGTLVPGRASRPRHRTNFVWRGHAERQTYGELAPRGRPDSHLLQRAQHRPPRRQSRSSLALQRTLASALPPATSMNRTRRSFLSVMVCPTPIFRMAGQRSARRNSAPKTLNAELRKNSADAKPVLTVTANVSNTGKMAAEEVVQLYVRLQGTSVEEPVRKLKGFQRVRSLPAKRRR